MTKDFCRGGKRPGFLIGSSNKSQSGRRKWRRWTQNEEAGPATIWAYTSKQFSIFRRRNIKQILWNLIARPSATFICRDMLWEGKQWPIVPFQIPVTRPRNAACIVLCSCLYSQQLRMNQHLRSLLRQFPLWTHIIFFFKPLTLTMICMDGIAGIFYIFHLGGEMEFRPPNRRNLRSRIFPLEEWWRDPRWLRRDSRWCIRHIACMSHLLSKDKSSKVISKYVSCLMPELEPCATRDWILNSW